MDTNVIVSNGWALRSEAERWFGKHEPIIYIPCNWDMYDLLFHAGFFKSKGEARKNWKYTGKEIPKGWSEYTTGKLKDRLFIWHPFDTGQSWDDCMEEYLNSLSEK